jgi:hypothetical protein
LLSFYEMGQAEEKVKEAFLSLVQILTNWARSSIRQL